MSRRRTKTVAPPPKPSTSREAVFYVRVSTAEQMEGFSLPAQVEAAKAYASKNGMTIVEQFQDVESASRAGRKQFNEMIKFLKKKQNYSIICEKTDRLYRNEKDSVTIGDLIFQNDLHVHFHKEGTKLARTSTSSDKLAHGFRVLIAKHHGDNLSEEVRKGLNEKARQGIYPLRAPVGYMTNHSTKRLEVDPVAGPIVRQLFERYAAGTHSLSDLHKFAAEAGLKSAHTRTVMSRASIHNLLFNPIYYGRFEFKGVLHNGVHAPLVTKELFDKVNTIMEGRYGGTYQERTFAFTGLITCGKCGCAITAELKKGKYIYYRCTGNRGCNKKGIREEALAEQMGAVLARIQLDECMAETLRIALKESLVDQARYHEEVVKGLQAQETKLAGRLRNLYLDKLDGQVDATTYSNLKAEWDQELDKVQVKLAAHQTADRKSLEFGVQLFELAQTAFSSYLQRSVEEKREILNFVCSNYILDAGKVMPTYRQPFDVIAIAPSMMQKRSEPDPSDPTRCLVKWR